LSACHSQSANVKSSSVDEIFVDAARRQFRQRLISNNTFVAQAEASQGSLQALRCISAPPKSIALIKEAANLAAATLQSDRRTF
jgi:hypothetical protein